MSETKKDQQNEEARVPSDDELRGHALQDHDRVKSELENDPDGHTTHRLPDQVAKRDEALDKVREVRAANEERTRRHSSVAIEEQVAAQTSGGGDKQIDVATADGRVYINTHGEAILDGDGCTNLQHILAKAKQAVS